MGLCRLVCRFGSTCALWGLERGPITPTLLTMMAPATTVMTGPLFSQVWRDPR